MDLTIKDRLFAEYPIPYPLSVFGGDDIDTLPLVDFDVFVQTCVDELGSDLYITDYQKVNSMQAYLPSDTISVVGAKLDYPFQGNRWVKASYNRYNQTVNVRYYPATVTFRRRLTMETVDRLMGDFLIYFKSYTLAKMAEKELTMLGGVKLDADNGSVDLQSLENFRQKCWDRYIELKDAIHIYAVGN